MSEQVIVLQVAKHPLGDATPTNPEQVICERCGKEYGIGDYPFCPHGGGSNVISHEYPFTTRNFNGKPITVTSRAHEMALCKEYGVTKRDDAAFLEKEYLGYNWQTKKQEFKEGRGVGLPGCWI